MMDPFDLEIDAYCVVCDRALPAALAVPQSSASSGSAPPPPSFPAVQSRDEPSAEPVASTSTAPPPSSSQRSRASDGSATAPRLKRTGSSTSTATNTSGRSAAGGALRRNKSTVKAHTHTRGHAHAHRSHSHANLAALAPLDGGTAAAGKRGKAALGERRSSKATTEEVIEVVEVRDGDADQEDDEAPPPPQGIYCSDECRRIDEARNALTLAHLGAGPSPFAGSALVHADSFSSFGSMHAPLVSSTHVPFDAMARRRSSGVSSSASYAPSRSNLSPIQSAAPTADVGQFDQSTGAFPFPSQSTSSAPPAARSASFAAPVSSSAPAPPMLNFGARRRSRGHELTGGYSYRPSLMERVSSSEGRATEHAGGVWLGADRGFSRPASAASEAVGAPRPSRSTSIGAGGSAARTRSADANMGGSTGRPSSAISSLRSMTSIGSTAKLPASSPARAAYQPGSSQRAELPRSRSTQPDPATSPLARHSFLVGSAPGSSALVSRRRGPSFGEPTVSETRPLELPSSRGTGLQRTRRSASSASLALMGSSLGRSYEPRPWAGPKRSESTASLSGFVAQGEMASPSPPPPPLPVSSSATSTVIPSGSSSYRDSTAPTAFSPSSASSYTPSHSSAFSARSSTAGSSENPSSSVGSSHALRGKSSSRGRAAAGLTMTPSATNLAARAAAEPAPARPPPSTIANAASANPALSYLKGDEPTKPALPDPPAAPAPAHHQRSFSWQQIPGVPTYAAYDVDVFRAARGSSASGERACAGPGEDEREGPMLPPPLPRPATAKERKRLFYFSDEQGGE